ncbi:MAG: phosphopantetheine-binding protein [Planctomycetota bacterium]|nr:phosphopantetheine-binding protein [Planctomycetota bacterium]
MVCTPIQNSDDLQAIAAKITGVLSEVIRVPAASIRLEDDLLVDLGLDSLALAELTMVLEQRTRRQVRADELLDVVTVGDLVGLFAPVRDQQRS